MIPLFPKFKKLDLSDRKEVEDITSTHKAYSDFNFTSLWCWNIKDETKISKLNGNLVVLFTDYLTTKSFYSFVGSNNTEDTVRELLRLADREGLDPVLRLIPEESIRDSDLSMFHVVEDRDSFDYLYSAKRLIDMDGHEFREKRKHKRYFAKTFPHKITVLDLSKQEVKREILTLFSDWTEDKGDHFPPSYFKNEAYALLRFLLYCEQFPNAFAVGIYMDNKLVAASITENVKSTYNLGHFQKARTKLYKGINIYLVNHLALQIAKKGVEYLNFEQDLGIPGLRESKESYVPCGFLKKYSISIKK